MKRPFALHAVLISSLLFLVSMVLTTTARAQDPAGLPDTPQGRLITTYLEAFNSGSIEVMLEFSEKHRTEAARAMRTPEEQAELYEQLRREIGDLTFQSVVDVSENRIATFLKNNREDWFQVTFNFEGDDAPLIDIISIDGPVDADMTPIDEVIVDATIEGVIGVLKKAYVFPGIATDMEKAVREHAVAGRYEGITSASQLARMLTEDLRAVCHDRHLRVRPGAMRGGPNPTPEQIEQRREEDRLRNFGFEISERLEGNIGYIKFNMFHDSDEAQEVAAAIVEPLLDTDALIFDVRDNGGGSPNMINFLSSYLFDEPVHLNSFYNRLSERTSESWTSADVPGGVKYGPDKPVYVLTSGNTFSAAEEFTYNLRNLERATIVGEQTGGGAHPVQGMRINGHFWISVPFARAVNPITGTNWEGVGVEPHVRTSRADALNAAWKHALESLIEHNSDRSRRIEEWQAALKALLDDS